jgi:hypothetical protein
VTDEAGRQTAESTVAEPGVGLDGGSVLQRHALARQRLARQRLDAEVDGVVDQRAADEELHRQVVDPLRIGALVDLLRFSQRWRADRAASAASKLGAAPAGWTT